MTTEDRGTSAAMAFGEASPCCYMHADGINTTLELVARARRASQPGYPRTRPGRSSNCRGRPETEAPQPMQSPAATISRDREPPFGAARAASVIAT